MERRVSKARWRHAVSKFTEEITKRYRNKRQIVIQSNRQTPNQIIFNVPVFEDVQYFLELPRRMNICGVDFSLRPWNHMCTHKLCFRCWVPHCVPSACKQRGGQVLRDQVCGFCGQLNHDIDHCGLKKAIEAVEDIQKRSNYLISEKWCTNCESSGHGPKDYKSCTNPVVQAMAKRMEEERFDPEWFRYLNNPQSAPRPSKIPKKANLGRFTNSQPRRANPTSQPTSSFNASFASSTQATNTSDPTPAGDGTPAMLSWLSTQSQRFSNMTLSDSFVVGPLARPVASSEDQTQPSSQSTLYSSLSDRQPTCQGFQPRIDDFSDTEIESVGATFDTSRTVNPLETLICPSSPGGSEDSTDMDEDFTDMDEDELVELGNATQSTRVSTASRKANRTIATARSPSRTVASTSKTTTRITISAFNPSVRSIGAPPHSLKRPRLDFDQDDGDDNQYRKPRFVVTGERSKSGGYSLRGLSPEIIMPALNEYSSRVATTVFSPAVSQNQGFFEKIPAEIRNMIYGYMGVDATFSLDKANRFKGPKFMSYLLVSPAFHTEFVSYFFSNETIVISTDEWPAKYALAAFKKHVRPVHRERIRHLRISTLTMEGYIQSPEQWCRMHVGDVTREIDRSIESSYIRTALTCLAVQRGPDQFVRAQRRWQEGGNSFSRGLQRQESTQLSIVEGGLRLKQFIDRDILASLTILGAFSSSLTTIELGVDVIEFIRVWTVNDVLAWSAKPSSFRTTVVYYFTKMFCGFPNIGQVHIRLLWNSNIQRRKIAGGQAQLKELTNDILGPFKECMLADLREKVPAASITGVDAE
ncbi:hypothetical protein BDV96DRAFT_592508 [Lophiotrema nucula]|uniref:Uncharacterized protein n=1 Tax=Lophiotrema nucula TaxID=690887 RepID=A0A6A5YDR1_9PLEO|nr:hypothetical protein BDV96DRAFT_592508 [Lophiotrema nucula]